MVRNKAPSGTHGLECGPGWLSQKAWGCSSALFDLIYIVKSTKGFAGDKVALGLDGLLPACLLLATAKLIQLPCLEQFAFGRVDAKKMGVFICTPEEHACMFGETEDFREKGAQETC